MTDPARSGQVPDQFFCGGCWRWQPASLITRHKKRSKPLCAPCLEKAKERKYRT